MGSIKETIAEVMGPVMKGQSKFFCIGYVTEHGQLLAGVPSSLMYNDADVNTEIALLTAEYFHTYPAFSWDIYNFEADALGQPRITATYGVPDIDQTQPIIKGEEDLYKLKWPTENPLDAGRYPLFLKQVELAAKYMGAYQPDTFPIASSFSLACELCSFAGFTRLMRKDPALAHKIMERIVKDIHTPLVKAFAERFPGTTLLIADAWELIPNISPQNVEKFVWPYYDMLREETKNMDITLTWYQAYGEKYVPDPEQYLIDKFKYKDFISVLFLQDSLPPEFYRNVAVKTGHPLWVVIPSKVTSSGPEDAIVEFMKNAFKKTCVGLPPEKYIFLSQISPVTPDRYIKVAQAVGEALSILPCPTAEEIDAMEIKVPEFEETFEEFCRRKAKENPDGYTFKWLDQATFDGLK